MENRINTGFEKLFNSILEDLNNKNQNLQDNFQVLDKLKKIIEKFQKEIKSNNNEIQSRNSKYTTRIKNIIKYIKNIETNFDDIEQNVKKIYKNISTNDSVDTKNKINDGNTINFSQKYSLKNPKEFNLELLNEKLINILKLKNKNKITNDINIFNIDFKRKYTTVIDEDFKKELKEIGSIKEETFINKDNVTEKSPGERNAIYINSYLPKNEDDLQDIIILDQPENDLDNRLITKSIIKWILEQNIKKQMIIVTHDPKIMLNADPIKIILCDKIENNNFI